MNSEEANDLFYYLDGNIFWRKDRKMVSKDSIAGSKNKAGYKKVSVNGKCYQIHRVIFLMINGYMPKLIDHIDLDRQNNLIDNLRPCTFTQNFFNKPRGKNNTSGEKGVSWNVNSKKWLVYITTETVKQKHFGGYEDFELAQLIAIEARSKYQGEFCNNN